MSIWVDWFSNNGNFFRDVKYRSTISTIVVLSGGVSGQFLDRHFPNGPFPEGVFLDGQFPEDIFPADSFPKYSSPNGQFPERTFPRTDIFPNHVFYFKNKKVI